MNLELLKTPGYFLQHLDLVWTFLLLLTRFTGLLTLLPGVGAGLQGLAVRMPAAIVLSITALTVSPVAPLSANWVIMIVAMASEFLFGLAMGMVPLLLVSAVQMAGQVASTAMGLGGAQLFDPSSGGQVSDLSRIYGDLVIVFFLLLGGHHSVIHAVCGASGTIVPGAFRLTELTMNLLIERTGDLFRLGVMVAAPVIVALLLTQFVMGLISRAVPTVNIFIISFPLTIGIGLILSVLALPEVIHLLGGEIAAMDTTISAVTNDAIPDPKVPKARFP